MIQTFACPSCGGPLEYTGGHDKTIRCPFCANSVIVPKELRARTAELTTPQKATNVRLILICAAFILAGGLAMLLVLAAKRAPLVTPPAPPRPQPIPTVPRTPPAEPGFASVVMTFGSEGIGPGMFTDARSIAVDEAGRIYVGEYGSGRIQA